jgi:hypothetical protein
MANECCGSYTLVPLAVIGAWVVEEEWLWAAGVTASTVRGDGKGIWIVMLWGREHRDPHPRQG